MSVKPRVLVTGASGFIGRHVLLPLVERGFEVHAVGNSRKGTADVAWYAADLLSENARRNCWRTSSPATSSTARGISSLVATSPRPPMSTG